ncbi:MULTISPECIES: hypothetical protein [Bacillaceae]|uniref:Uncharacterized protein n=1 Tax=Evansella alkalicola TaxID=745819 RepID=A0ABS6JYI3_9BACI|nr:MULTISPECIES: hypothetical protein [Bacillaceae]MBU9722714.1 hypothetical protein [Bacillus alkalicola]
MENITIYWLPDITAKILNCDSQELDPYKVALEGWRRGLTLNFHTIPDYLYDEYDISKYDNKHCGVMFSLTSLNKELYFLGLTQKRKVSNYRKVCQLSEKVIDSFFPSSFIRKNLNLYFDLTPILIPIHNKIANSVTVKTIPKNELEITKVVILGVEHDLGHLIALKKEVNKLNLFTYDIRVEDDYIEMIIATENMNDINRLKQIVLKQFRTNKQLKMYETNHDDYLNIGCFNVEKCKLINEGDYLNKKIILLNEKLKDNKDILFKLENSILWKLNLFIRKGINYLRRLFLNSK